MLRRACHKGTTPSLTLYLRSFGDPFIRLFYTEAICHYDVLLAKQRYNPYGCADRPRSRRD